MVVIVALVTVK